MKNPVRAKFVAGYFKTGPGEYGEGDVFWGMSVPQVRDVAKKFWRDVAFSDIKKLLKSPVHEQRQVALFMAALQFARADTKQQATYFNFYLANTRYINNWDLIDLSAPTIVGGYLLDKAGRRTVLRKLARSKSIWERRIAIITTAAFIRAGEFDDTLAIAEILLADSHDLIHKAVGWMLREVGKKDQEAEERFLRKHYRRMPRTMLRYAIEKFPEAKRGAYLRGEI